MKHMSSPSPTAWLRRLRTAFAASAQLLAPRAEACLICGKPQAGPRSAASPNDPKLPAGLRDQACGACLSAIPWISRIQCPKCGRAVRCEDCARSPHRAFVCNRSAVRYDPTMRALLAQYKYRGNEQLAPLLGDMLLPPFEALTASLHESAPAARRGKRQKLRIADRWDAVTYVPVSRERALDRGFNQAEQLAAHLARRYGIPLMHLLVRARHTEKQSFKTRAERIKDTRQLFAVDRAEVARLHSLRQDASKTSDLSREACRILLVDDIYTTGSTAEACSLTLGRHIDFSHEIYVLTWARS
ncbi:ComF family protein [Paenibacillus arenilitoris]|uniref:ComF family protein n=1 Tax=Paenibacillus arenilitoris TaxID=2772299 RepID=A0A927CM74_9BACL|nr:ComF family protein [Paenibacillus arenilitoris]MBD2868406.1 ComF family protein [Paenibacillus arenilitoris]